MTTYPPLLENSHDDGSKAAIRTLLIFLCMWETQYHIANLLIQFGLKNYPGRILDASLFGLLDSAAVSNGGKEIKNENGNGKGNENGSTKSRNEKKSPLDEAKHTLSRRGPSYLLSFFHSLYATYCGIHHLLSLWNASNLDKLFIPSRDLIDSYRGAHLQVATTNTLFLSYLLYDLFHILLQFPKLGGVDTMLHHILFASCSVINGTYGLMAFPFGWLIIGEGSTIFLNWRWFLLKSGRDGKNKKDTSGGGGILMDDINRFFAATFFLTRIIFYSIGIVHLFFFSKEELIQLPEMSGVPKSLLGLTCACMILGWGLNMLWGYKIMRMVVGGGKKKGKTKEQ